MASIRKRTPWRLVLEDVSRSKIYSTQKQAEAEKDAYYAQGLMGLRVEPVPGGSYEVRIRSKHAQGLVKTFRRRAEADAWAKEREGEIAKRQFVDYREADRNTLGDLFARYDRERLDGRSLEDADKSRIGKLRGHPIALLRMSVLQSSDVLKHACSRTGPTSACAVCRFLETHEVLTVATDQNVSASAIGEGHELRSDYGHDQGCCWKSAAQGRRGGGQPESAGEGRGQAS